MKVLKITGKVILIILAVIVILAGGLIGYLSATEYSPEPVEEIVAEGSSNLHPGKQPVSVLSWNIGYGALGDNADFFMDGGTHVYTADKERIMFNLDGIKNTISSVNPDIILLQEVDADSSRTGGIDQKQYYQDTFSNYESTFAFNFKAAFVPYPIPPIGKVNSGIMTLSKYDISSAARVQLPCPFSWPIRIVNLKRCMMVDRLPIEGNDKELVVINSHLEAYDDGEGKAAQAEMLREFMEDEASKGNYVIVGGDFNQVFSSIEGFPIQAGMWKPGSIDVNEFSGDWSFLMSNDVPSCRSLDKPYDTADKETFQFYAIDGFIVSSNITVESYEVMNEGFVYSDHNPVLLRCVLN